MVSLKIVHTLRVVGADGMKNHFQIYETVCWKSFNHLSMHTGAHTHTSVHTHLYNILPQNLCKKMKRITLRILIFQRIWPLIFHLIDLLKIARPQSFGKIYHTRKHYNILCYLWMRSFINIQMQSLYTPISSVPSTSCTVHTENFSLNLRIEAEHNTFSQFISDEYEKREIQK